MLQAAASRGLSLLLLLFHGWECPPCITQGEQGWVMDGTATFSTRIPVLLHAGRSFLAHSGRERWDPLLHSRESQQRWSNSSTICSVPQGLLLRSHLIVTEITSAKGHGPGQGFLEWAFPLTAIIALRGEVVTP